VNMKSYYNLPPIKFNACAIYTTKNKLLSTWMISFFLITWINFHAKSPKIPSWPANYRCIDKNPLILNHPRKTEFSINQNYPTKTQETELNKIEGKKTLPHAPSVFQRIRSTLQRTIKMTMHFMLPFPALIHQRQLKQSPNIRSFAR